MDPSKGTAELPPLFDDLQMIVMSAQISMGVMGILLNAVLIFLLCWSPKKTLQKTYLACVLNLACSDFAVAVICTILTTKKTLQGRVYENYSDCAVDGLINCFLSIYSVWSIMLLAVDRFFIVVLKKSFAVKKILLFVLINFVVSLAIACSPLYLQADHMFIIMPSGLYCMMDLTLIDEKLGGIAYGLAVAYGFGLFVILVSYMKIMHVILKGKSMLKTIQEMGHFGLEDSQKTLPREEVSAMVWSSISLHASAPASFTQRWRASILSQNENGTRSDPSKRGSLPSVAQIPSSFPKMTKKTFESGLALRTIFMGCTYVSFYLPFAVFGICQMSGYGDLRTIDIISSLAIVCSPIMDPIWTLLLDQHVHKCIVEVKELFQKWALK